MNNITVQSFQSNLLTDEAVVILILIQPSSTNSKMAIPTRAPAVVAEATGGPEVLEFRVDHPISSLKDGQILVQNAISGVNYVDTYFRNGLYPSVMPTVLGREGAGTIVAVGANVDETKLQVGDRVVWLGDSGYAQYSAVNAAKAMRLPDQVSFEDATASCLSVLTALALAEESYKVMKGDRVLLLAAAGSVGTLMTRILKLRGAEVIALVGSPEKAAVAKRLGADHVIDYRTPEGDDWPKVVRQLTDGKGVDVVYDSVGKDTWQKSIEAVKRKGTIIWFGNASGPVPPLTLQ